MHGSGSGDPVMLIGWFPHSPYLLSRINFGLGRMRFRDEELLAPVLRIGTVHLKSFRAQRIGQGSPSTRDVGRPDEAAVVLRRSGHCKGEGWILRRWKRIFGRSRMRTESWRVASRDDRQNREDLTGLCNEKLCRPAGAWFVAAAVAPARTSRMHWMVFKSLGKRFCDIHC